MAKRKTEVQANMTTAVEMTSDSSDLDAMLAGLGEDIPVDEPVTEAVDDELAAIAGEVEIEAAVATLPSEVSEDLLEDAVFAAEVDDAKREIYAAQEAPEAALPLEVLDGEADSEGSAAVEAAADKPAKEKKERTPRVHFAKHSEKIVHKLGDKMGECMILEPADLDLSPEELKAKQEALLEAIDKLAVKAGNKARLLFQFLAVGGKLNEYLRRAFVCLATEGEITTGDKGNYITLMTAPPKDSGLKPFGLGTARSQVSQLNVLLPALKIAAKEKGRLILNADSVLFAAVRAAAGI